MQIIREEQFIQSKTKTLALSLLLIYPQYEPDEAADKNDVRIVQMVHGMAEYKERYIPLMENLAKNGYICCISDTRGHGASRHVVSTSDDGLETYDEKDLGYFFEVGYRAIDTVMDDISRVGEYLNERFNSDKSGSSCIKRFLFGHSMGSLEVRRYAAEHDDELRGLIVCGSPSQNPAAGAGILLCSLTAFFKGDRYRSKFIDNMAFGHYNDDIDGDMSFRWLSENADNVKAYNDDPLCGFTFTVNGFSFLMRLMRDVYSPKYYDVRNKNLPVRFISGASDPCRVTDEKFKDAVQFMRDIGYKNVSSRLFEHMRHEILMERDSDAVCRDILDFLNAAE